MHLFPCIVRPKDPIVSSNVPFCILTCFTTYHYILVLGCLSQLTTIKIYIVHFCFTSNLPKEDFLGNPLALYIDVIEEVILV